MRIPAHARRDSEDVISPSELVGTWQFARPEEGSPRDFLYFTYTQAFDFIYEGNTRQILQLWYQLEEPDRIRFRSHPEDEGWTCNIEHYADTLSITCNANRTVCTRAKPEDIPEWFQREVAEHLART